MCHDKACNDEACHDDVAAMTMWQKEVAKPNKAYGQLMTQSRLFNMCPNTFRHVPNC